MIRIEENKLRKEMYQAHKYISKNIRLLRMIKGLRQDYVAEMLHMSRSCYCNLESGAKVPDFETVYILSKFYDVNLDYLLSFDIAEQMLALLRIDRQETDPLHFIERYTKLSHGAKEQIRLKVATLLRTEEEFNKFPWDYGDKPERR